MLAHADDIILGFVREHILQHFKGHHVGLAVKFNQKHNPHFLGVEMQFLTLDIDIAGKDVIQNDVFDERALVVFFIVKVLDVAQRNGQHFGHFVGHFVFTLDKDNVLRFVSAGERTIGIAAADDAFAGEGKFVTDTLTHFADPNQFGAGNDNAVFIDDTDDAVDRVLHLVDHTLE